MCMKYNESKKLTIRNILQITKGKLIIGREDIICESFSKDTRQIKTGDVYVGIKGDNFDGNKLYNEAFEKGANVCILQDIKFNKNEIEKYSQKNIILVEDTIKALGQIAKYKRELYDIPVIAVTGSVGKTSTKDIIASVVKEKYKTKYTQGNLNNHIGLPMTILEMEDHEALVVEMGMNHFGEIDYLSSIANPTVAVITNIGTSHIGILGSRENILKAKLEILNHLKNNGTVIINNDNDLLNKWGKENKVYSKLTFGIDEKSDIMPYNIEIKDTYSRYKIKIDNFEYDITVPVSGKHFIYNSLAAITVGLSLGIEVNEIINGIKEFKLTKKRMEIEKLENNITIINDSYNASYDSIKAALEYLNTIDGNRKIAILGEVLEAGKFSEKIHLDIGKEVVKNKIDMLITQGKYARHIGNQAIIDGMNKKDIYEFQSNNDIAMFLKNVLESGDIVLLKASNRLNFTEILNKLKEAKND